MERFYNLPPFKCATLSARLELQDVFYSIPGADVEEDVGEDEDEVVDPYKVALEKLDAYFAPKRHESYERFDFWALKPEVDEPFEKFVLRVQQHASKCQFGRTEQEARDTAIMDKVIQLASIELREKLLEKKNPTVGNMINQVNIFQMIKAQAKEMGQPATKIELNTEVNQIQAKPDNPKPMTNVECFRCGRKGHYARDPKCPAKDKTCLKCKMRGHFAVKCQQQQRGVKRSNDSQVTTTPPEKKSKVNAVATDSEAKPLESFIYNIGDGDERIWCRVGGVLVEMLIDSGSSQNIIDEATWTYMKNNDAVIQEVEGEARSILRAYAQNDPLQILKVFKAEIAIAEGNDKLLKTATFYVIKGGSLCLLGRYTAKLLGVLILGLPSTQDHFIGQMEEKRITPFPKMKGIKLVIPIDDSVQPVTQHARRPPIALLKKVEEKLEELERSDIIEPVNEHSAWVSPIVVISKDNGDIRICVDMRQANKAIKRENHLMPVLEDFLPRLESAKIFSRLDIKNAFHQIELDESSRHITTFITHKGMFRYKRLMFGISCAPEIFQKVMEQILCGCHNAMNYIDDIIVFGVSLEDHDKALNKVLATLKENDVLLNQSKCIFRVYQIQFLGHVLSEKGIRPMESKVEAVQKFRSPETKEEVRSFLGLITYVSRFLPDCATATFPLRQLMCSSDPFIWKEIHQEAFDKLKNMIADASPVGLGAVLLQFEDDTVDKPLIIAYASKCLSKTERKYCQTEKEALALVCNEWKYGIRG
ncbi:uncharacterized protein K02A2.6-like [Lutzomyia longipalpis]|uniref:uncharacterized protein K02A2.6-like n=1 Tax=Lutzomyia longipalpis TaxID=7200 RepID=UPI00248378A5|nr:uncharacterized protein K02A2.6-like [Lutzomyia longipalpis]